jgi:hypothetical protein
MALKQAQSRLNRDRPKPPVKIIEVSELPRERALRIAKYQNFEGCDDWDLKDIYKLTGSKAVLAEIRRRKNPTVTPHWHK